jgi:simple sugar transport system ATP-binding protein
LIPVLTDSTILTLKGIEKRFPGVQALKGVDLEIRRGEVHALMGQNGAGKSTLIKVLTGVYRRDGGTITFKGRPFFASSPAEAQQKGLSTIYQEVNLIPTLSVAENLFLGRAPRGWLGLKWRALRRKARELLGRYGLNIDVEAMLGSYPVAIQQMVGIARAVDIDARLLIMDEPTSSLDARETQRLFELMGHLKRKGLSILFVTHFIDQVFRISDRVTVLRNGGPVGTFETGKLTPLGLVGHMIGKTLDESDYHDAERMPRPGSHADPEPVLKAVGLGRKGAVEPFDLQLNRGEVVGMAGLLGSGRTEAAKLLFFADRPDQGEVEVLGKSLSHASPREAIQAGMAFCPEDRKTEGIFPGMSVRDNIVLVVQRKLNRWGVMSRSRHQQIAEAFLRKLDIATPDLDKPVRELSGGNQQKVILARWLASKPMILILDEPTRGIDVGAKVEIEGWVDRLAGEGMAILFISSELDEVVRRSDRVMVLKDRRVLDALSGRRIRKRTILGLIAGGEEDGE